MKVSRGRMVQKENSLELDPASCAEIATDALYKKVNHQLPPDVQVDPGLRPYLQEELTKGMTRALERFYKEQK